MRWPAILAIALAVAACDASSSSPIAGHSASSAPASSAPVSTGGPGRGLVSRVPPGTRTTTIGRSGFRHDETFCAAGPVRGRVRYFVRGNLATLQLELSALPHAADLAVEWHNAHSPRGYTIASFRTDARGKPRPHLLRMFRAGETRASRILLATKRDHAVAHLRPC